MSAGKWQDRLGGGLEASVAQRADESFVVHATWAVNRTPGMASRVTPQLVVADSGLRCDTFNFICSRAARRPQCVRCRGRRRIPT